LQWVLNDPQYTSWLSKEKTQLLWVTGHTGCGKTTLSSYVVDCLSDNLPISALVCRFFCDGKIEQQRNLRVLFEV